MLESHPREVAIQKGVEELKTHFAKITTKTAVLKHAKRYARKSGSSKKQQSYQCLIDLQMFVDKPLLQDCVTVGDCQEVYRRFIPHAVNLLSFDWYTLIPLSAPEGYMASPQQFYFKW